MKTRGRFAITFAVAVGTASVPMDTAVNVAFPHITGDLGLPPDAIRWVVVSYVLTYASLLLVAGRLADRFGHRRLFVAGLLVNAVGLLACALAPTLSTLVAGRVVQGIGAAGILAAGPALITLARPAEERLGALGSYTLAFGVAGALGPLAGGLVVPVLEWGGVFWFRIPVVLAGLVLALTFVSPRAGPADARPAGVDPVAFAGVVLALVCGLLAVGQLPRSAGQPGLVVGLAALAITGLVLYRRRTRTHPDGALFSGALLANRRFVMLNVAHGTAAFAEFTIMLLVPFRIAARFGFTAIEAGLVMAAAPAGIVLASALVRWRGGSALPGALPPCAVVLLAMGLGAIALWPHDTSMVVMIATLVLAGAGYGLYHVSAMDRVMGSLPEHERGVAGSISMLVRTAGVACSASLMSWWFVASGGNLEGGFFAAFAASFEVAGVLALVAAVLAWLAARPAALPRRPG